MATRQRAADIGAERARTILASISAEIRHARRDRDLSQEAVGRAVGLSPAQVSRIERGLSSATTLHQLATILAVLGLELSVRAYPAGEPIRDAAHTLLLGRLRAHLHPALTFRTEVPLPAPGDRRAWDAVIAGRGWLTAVEAETAPRDYQALERRLTLKLRDSGVPTVILLLLDSRHNRRFVRERGLALTERFPVEGPRALERLSTGADPGGSAVILL